MNYKLRKKQHTKKTKKQKKKQAKHEKYVKNWWSNLKTSQGEGEKVIEYKEDKCHTGNVKVFKDPRTDAQISAGGYIRGAWVPVDTLFIDVGYNAKPILEMSGFFSKKIAKHGDFVLTIEWPDFGVPYSLFFNFWRDAIEVIREFKTERGMNTMVACTGGHGRTGTVLSILAYMMGVKGAEEDPVEFIRRVYCEHAVETEKQLKYIEEVTGIKSKCIGSNTLRHRDGNTVTSLHKHEELEKYLKTLPIAKDADKCELCNWEGESTFYKTYAGVACDICAKYLPKSKEEIEKNEAYNKKLSLQLWTEICDIVEKHKGDFKFVDPLEQRKDNNGGTCLWCDKEAQVLLTDPHYSITDKQLCTHCIVGLYADELENFTTKNKTIDGFGNKRETDQVKVFENLAKLAPIMKDHEGVITPLKHKTICTWCTEDAMVILNDPYFGIEYTELCRDCLFSLYGVD